MSDKPIQDHHAAFAQELIALARKHGANNLEVKFCLTGSKLWPPLSDPSTGWSDLRVNFQWSEGRHGDRSRAMLRAETTLSVEETPNA